MFEKDLPCQICRICCLDCQFNYRYLWNIGRGCGNFQFWISFSKLIIAHSILLRVFEHHKHSQDKPHLKNAKIMFLVLVRVFYRVNMAKSWIAWLWNIQGFVYGW